MATDVLLFIFIIHHYFVYLAEAVLLRINYCEDQHAFVTAEDLRTISPGHWLNDQVCRRMTIN